MRWVLLISILCLFGCDTTREGTLKGKTIEIIFKGKFNTNEWIEIDGMRFVHQITDTSGVVNVLYDAFEGYREQQVEDNSCIIPPTEVYIGLGDKWGVQRINQSQMAYYFIMVFNRVMNNNNQVDYRILSTDPMIFSGRVSFTRIDGKTIHIRTSKNYPALVTTKK